MKKMLAWRGSFSSRIKKIQLLLFIPEITIHEGRSHPFFRLLTLVDSFGFNKVEDDVMCAYLNIDGIWERS